MLLPVMAHFHRHQPNQHMLHFRLHRIRVLTCSKMRSGWHLISIFLVLEAQADLLNESLDTGFRTDNGKPIPTLQFRSVMISIPVFIPWLVHK